MAEMPRPYILAHNDKWFVFLGSALVALCTTKSEALEIQRQWIRKSQALANTLEDTLPLSHLPERVAQMMENGSNSNGSNSNDGNS